MAVEELVEDKVLTHAAFKDRTGDLTQFKIPSIYSKLGETLLPKIALGSTSTQLLQAFSNIDVTSQKITQALRANPYYQHFFRRTLESKAKREDIPSLEAGVVLLGMQNSRNLILALQAFRTFKNQHPPVDAKGVPQLKAQDVIPYAIKTEELLTADKNGYAETAFAAGLLFDLINLHAQEIGVKAQVITDEIYKHGIKTAIIASELVKPMTNFAFRKYVYAAALLHDIGKLAMAVVEPTYAAWLEQAKKADLNRGLRHYSEEMRFELTHAQIGGLLAHSLKIFRPISKALSHHHDPHRVKGFKDTYELACLLSLASNMANQYRKVATVEDPLVETWRGPELKGFRLKNQDIVTATLNLQI